MAYSCSEDLDHLLAGLASMGFELDKCQEAVKAGHTTLETAVEWLLEKKGNPATGVPLSDSGTNLQEEEDPSSGDIELHKTVSVDQQVSSRCMLSEEGKKAKERFIEKERELARAEAKKRKMEVREARKKILMQIADDREMQTRKTHTKAETLSSEQSVSNNQYTKLKLTKDESTMCRLQVRLPNSQVKKGHVPVKTKLEEAVTLVCSDSSLRAGKIEILQPFPHRTFSPSELESTLEELGLCPSAMVVVQKGNLQTDGRSSPEVDEQGVVVGRDVDQPNNIDVDRNHPGVEIDEPHPSNINRDPQNIVRIEQEEPVGLERILPNLPVPAGVDIPGIPGNHPQHQWGAGMILGAVEHNPPAAEPEIQESSPGESAARRIEMRAQLLQHRLADAGKSYPTEQCQLHREVRSLEMICIDNIALRLAGHPHLQPISTLGALPHKVCDKIIQQLINNKALSPKTMQAFFSCCLRYLKLDCYLLVTNELLTALSAVFISEIVVAKIELMDNIRFHGYMLRHSQSKLFCKQLLVILHKHITLLSLKSCPLITDKAMEAVSALKKLQSLNINQCSQLTDKCFTYIKDLPALTVLQMDNTKVTDQGVHYFVANASCASNLTHYSLCCTAITDLSLEDLKELKSLKILELENTKITKLDVLSSLNHIEMLNVSSTKVSNNSMVTLSGFPCLVSLNILSTPVNDMGLQHLHDLQLTYLNLPGRLNITDQGVQHIQGLPLSALHLSDYINVTDVGVRYISRIHSLTKLALNNTKLTDAGMSSLSELTNLVELNIDRTAVTDEGCSVISNFLNLQILSLSSTQISNKLLTRGVLNHCWKLNQLNLSRTRVSNKGIRCLSLGCLTLLNLDWTRVTTECHVFLTGCPSLKALRTNNCTPSVDDSDDEED